MKQKNLHILVSVIIIALGLLLIFPSTSNFLRSGNWWPLILIIGAIVSIVKNGVGIANLAIGFIGVSLFLRRWSWFPTWLRGRGLAGLIVVIVGLFFLLSLRTRYRGGVYTADKDGEEAESSNRSYTAVFSGQQIKSTSDNLDGTTFFALFGGIKCDFSLALIESDVVVDTTAIFGGVELLFPPGINVEVHSTPLFGGVENKKQPPLSESVPTVTVRALSLFGGVTIK
ncbi:MAG: cell wall-active antibiotics response protein [Spirochaetales bacterium]|nr:cell wall-active antibiotics response protein [Spirochaetales bacterium]